MASGKTNNLELNQWAKTDPVSREEMNENFEKLDAILGEIQLMGRLVWGSYRGNDNNQVTIDFSDSIGCQPLFLYVCENRTDGEIPYRMFLVKGINFQKGREDLTGSAYINTITWSEATVSWSNMVSPAYALNSSNSMYYFFAIG